MFSVFTCICALLLLRFFGMSMKHRQTDEYAFITALHHTDAHISQLTNHRKEKEAFSRVTDMLHSPVKIQVNKQKSPFIYRLDVFGVPFPCSLQFVSVVYITVPQKQRF